MAAAANFSGHFDHIFKILLVGDVIPASPTRRGAPSRAQG